MRADKNYTLITDEASAFAKAESIRAKIHAGTNPYAVFVTDGMVHESRTNKSLFQRWLQTGKPDLVGVYNKRASVGTIAADLLTVSVPMTEKEKAASQGGNPQRPSI